MREYREVYKEMHEDALLQLIVEFDDLESDAQRALIQELRERGRSEQELLELVGAGRKQRLPLATLPGADPDLTRRIGNVRSVNGIGRSLYGKASYYRSDEFGYEEWDATLWWIFLWIPVIPRGAFRMRRKLASSDRDRPSVPSLFPGYSFVVVRELPFRWSGNTGKLLLSLLLFWLPIAIALVTFLRS